MDLSSGNRGVRLGGEVAPPLGAVKEEVAVLVVLVRRYFCVDGAAVRRAVDDEATLGPSKCCKYLARWEISTSQQLRRF